MFAFKKIFLYLLLLLVVACKKDEDFNPNDYDGEYPRNIDGSRIKTYTPVIYGGEIQVKFNGHDWNHAPYLSIKAVKAASPLPENGKQVLSINLSSHVTYGFPDACVLETVGVVIPLAQGRLIFNDESGNHISTKGIGVNFFTVNCDAAKDHYKLDLTKTSWFEIKNYDETSRSLEAEFDFYFIIVNRNSDFGPIYPKHVNLKGKIKTVVGL